MLKILEEVAAQRIKTNEDNFQIQLSSVFMEAAVDEINKTREIKILQDKNMNEFKHTMLGKEFTIRNRAYRDNTNDVDVEEVLYKLLSKKNEKF